MYSFVTFERDYAQMFTFYIKHLKSLLNSLKRIARRKYCHRWIRLVEPDTKMYRGYTLELKSGQTHRQTHTRALYIWMDGYI